MAHEVAQPDGQAAPRKHFLPLGARGTKYENPYDVERDANASEKRAAFAQRKMAAKQRLLSPPRAKARPGGQSARPAPSDTKCGQKGAKAPEPDACSSGSAAASGGPRQRSPARWVAPGTPCRDPRPEPASAGGSSGGEKRVAGRPPGRQAQRSGSGPGSSAGTADRPPGLFSLSDRRGDRSSGDIDGVITFIVDSGAAVSALPECYGRLGVSTGTDLRSFRAANGAIVTAKDHWRAGI